MISTPTSSVNQKLESRQDRVQQESATSKITGFEITSSLGCHAGTIQDAMLTSVATSSADPDRYSSSSCHVRRFKQLTRNVILLTLSFASDDSHRRISRISVPDILAITVLLSRSSTHEVLDIFLNLYCSVGLSLK
jgi:hypothetical protein